MRPRQRRPGSFPSVCKRPSAKISMNILGVKGKQQQEEGPDRRRGHVNHNVVTQSPAMHILLTSSPSTDGLVAETDKVVTEDRMHSKYAFYSWNSFTFF